MANEQATHLSSSGLRRSTADPAVRASGQVDEAADTGETAGWSEVRQAAGARIAPNPRWPMVYFKSDLEAIQDQLIDGERILEKRTLRQGGRGRATGAIAVTTRRLLVVDLSRLLDPVAETVLFSEIKHVGCRRRGLGGFELTVRTRLGRQYRGLESKQRASAKRFVTALQAQIDNPSASHLREVLPTSIAARPPTALARLGRTLERAQTVLAALLGIAALLFLTGAVGREVSEAVFACSAFVWASRKLSATLVARSGGASRGRGPSRRRIALRHSAAE
jgi:hypothetical protein